MGLFQQYLYLDDITHICTFFHSQQMGGIMEITLLFVL